MTNLPQEVISADERFREAISVYTDQQAVEDGTLVDITRYTDVRFRGYLIK